MKHSDNVRSSFQPKLLNLIRGSLELVPTLQSSFIRNCNISDMSPEEKYLLYFSIIDQSANALVITDDNRNIVYVNKKFEAISGYSAEEVIGKNPKILSSGNTPKETYADMHQALESKEQWKGEFINIHRNGQEYIEEAIISPITNTRGDVVCFLAEKKDITAQKKAEKTVNKLTYFDSLTQVYNRAYFIQETGVMTAAPLLETNHFAVLFIDLNRFKKLNDIYGHLTGDKALQLIARRLARVISGTEFIARVGGDEFVVVHKCATAATTSQLANSIIRSFQSPLIIDNQEHYLGASIGSAIWPTDGLTLTQILSRADLAMYHAKTSSSHYTPYSKTIGSKYSRELQLSSKLNIAIKKNYLSLAYQPKVNLQTKQIEGMEALLRWNDPELGTISPAEFIPVAEKYNMMITIGNWVIQQVCKQLNIWQEQGKSLNGRVAINISVQQIEHPKFYQQLISTLAREGISPDKIKLEVTESLLISDPDRIIHIIANLRALGVSIAIDDFGTGYSSLSYLNKLRVNELKIDRSFINQITIDQHEQAIVKSIIELGHNLGLSVTAEGVETWEQLDYLLSLGCDTGQGYLFYKPLPADELAALPIFTEKVPEMV